MFLEFLMWLPTGVPVFTLEFKVIHAIPKLYFQRNSTNFYKCVTWERSSMIQDLLFDFIDKHDEVAPAAGRLDRCIKDSISSSSYSTI